MSESSLLTGFQNKPGTVLTSVRALSADIRSRGRHVSQVPIGDMIMLEEKAITSGRPWIITSASSTWR